MVKGPAKNHPTSLRRIPKNRGQRWPHSFRACRRSGVPEELPQDGGPNVSSKEMTSWLNTWGVRLRLSSAYYPQSNGRAEAGVKSLKRLLLGNIDHRGTLNTDQVAHALFTYRNTPLRGINKSPAQLALGRQIKDTFPLPRCRYNISSEWRHNLKEREIAMGKSNQLIKAKYDVTSKPLSELRIGTLFFAKMQETLNGIDLA